MENNVNKMTKCEIKKAGGDKGIVILFSSTVQKSDLAMQVAIYQSYTQYPQPSISIIFSL